MLILGSLVENRDCSSFLNGCLFSVAHNNFFVVGGEFFLDPGVKGERGGESSSTERSEVITLCAQLLPLRCFK